MPWGSDRWGSYRWSEREDYYLALVGATMIGSRTIRITFNHDVDPDDGLTNVLNWALLPLEFGGVSVEVVEVVPGEGTQVWYADLELSRDVTEGIDYRVTVLPGKVHDFGFFIWEPFNTATFNAIASMPYVVAAVPLSSKTLEVRFSKEMDETVEITSPDFYHITPPTRVRRVRRTGPAKVLLELVDAMVMDQFYAIEVSNDSSP